MKNFVIKYMNLKTGNFSYFECRASSVREAIDLMYETIDQSTHQYYDCYMNTTDVFEYYNIRS